MVKLEKEVGDREKAKEREFHKQMNIDSAAMKKKSTLAAEQSNLPGTVKNHLNEQNKKIDAERIRINDKSDRATVEQVLDKRTMWVIEAMLNNEKISHFEGCIATGKEANVYHTKGSMDLETKEVNYNIPVNHYAMKIYKTNAMLFKDR